jgi:hypothetical protein
MPAPVPQQYFYKEINANGTYLIKNGQGFLHNITVNVPGGGTAKVADAITDTTPYIAGQTAFTLPAAGTTLRYDVNFQTGLTIVVAGMTAGSITVSYA